MPEGRAFSHAFDSCFAERNRVLADLYAPLRTAYFRRRKKRKIVVLIPSEKIVDVVLPGIHPGHERGPCHGRDRRKCRAQLAECSLLLQSREIWQHAFANEPFGEFWIHAVESKNYGSLDLRFARCFSATQQSEQMPQWPCEKRISRVEECDE